MRVTEKEREEFVEDCFPGMVAIREWDDCKVMTLSLIIPAYNEERYIGASLESVKSAASQAFGKQNRLDIVVVDNASSDTTAEIARSYGARVIPEPQRSIARARNTGAALADGEILVFLDADTLVPENFFVRIIETMCDSCCTGGAIDTPSPVQPPMGSIILVVLSPLRSNNQHGAGRGAVLSSRCVRIA